MSNASLPDDFAELEPFADRWAIEGTAARDELRGRASQDQRQAFYNAISKRAAEALDYLDARQWGKYTPGEHCLMNMLLSYAHVSIAQEIQKDDEEKHARARKFMTITRSPADEGSI